MIYRINVDLLKEDLSFAFETTLATKKLKEIKFISKKRRLYDNIIVFWLQTIELIKRE